MTLLEYYSIHPTTTRVVHPRYEDVPMSTEFVLTVSDTIELLYETYDESIVYPDTHQICIAGHHSPINVGDVYELEMLIAFLAPLGSSIRDYINTCDDPFIAPPTMHLQLLGPAQDKTLIDLSIYDAPLNYN